MGEMDSFDDCAPEILHSLLESPVARDRLQFLMQDLFRKEAQLYFRAFSCDETSWGETFTWTIIGLGSVFEASRYVGDKESETFHSYEEARAWIDQSIESTRDEFWDIKDGGDPYYEDLDDFPLDVEVDRKPGDDEPKLLFKAICKDHSWPSETYTWTIQAFGSVFAARSPFDGGAFETFHSYQQARDWVDERVQAIRNKFLDEHPGDEFKPAIELDIKPDKVG